MPIRHNSVFCDRTRALEHGMHGAADDTQTEGWSGQETEGSGQETEGSG
jgi:hypothetical protein